MVKTNKIRRAFGVFLLVALFLPTTQVKAAFQYEHDPMDNPSAAQDIIVDENAVYGYSPNPSSTRLGEYASYDWSDEEVVEKAREDRIQYHTQNEELYQMIKDMLAAGNSIEEIARAVSTKRNEIRLEAYKDDPTGLEKVKKSNLETYGHEEGPTPDEQFERHGSWEAVIVKALKSNPGMDACLGLYDLYYDTYGITEKMLASEMGEGGTSIYEVKSGDCLWKIAEQKLHDGKRWQEIYELNQDTIQEKDLIYAGQKLILPAA